MQRIEFSFPAICKHGLLVPLFIAGRRHLCMKIPSWPINSHYLTKDRADRFLAATAKVLSLVLVTQDPELLGKPCRGRAGSNLESSLESRRAQPVRAFY